MARLEPAGCGADPQGLDHDGKRDAATGLVPIFGGFENVPIGVEHDILLK
jgi:hypothetical protein